MWQESHKAITQQRVSLQFELVLLASLKVEAIIANNQIALSMLSCFLSMLSYILKSLW